MSEQTQHEALHPGRALHPAPLRHQVPGAMMLYAQFASPAGWFLQELGGWGLSSLYCHGRGSELAQDLVRAHMPGFIVLALVALALSVSGTAVAYTAWQRARKERVGGDEGLAEQGEGRTRFTATWALLSSASFLVALVFHALQLWGAPLCGP